MQEEFMIKVLHNRKGILVMVTVRTLEAAVQGYSKEKVF